MSQVRFSNIRFLSLLLPFDDQFLSVVSKLDQLVSLDVSVDSHSEDIQSQLQFLLDRAPRLQSLSFGSWLLSSQVSPIENTRVLVYRLNLQNYANGSHLRYFNNQQCSILSRSPLGVQCETLLINVEKRTNIVDLVNTMMNLRALIVQCEDDRWNYKNSSLSKQDELIQWLRHRLPFTCTITRDSYITNNIRLWIR
jgi:hypothetical protein